MNPISNEFLPLKLGETKKVFLKNGASVSIKWKKKNTYIVCYKPENQTDYYSPYFLFEFDNKTLKRIIPYPNKRSFVIMVLTMIGFVYFNEFKQEFYVSLFGFAIAFIFILQVIVGIAAYQKIRKYVFRKNETSE